MHRGCGIRRKCSFRKMIDESGFDAQRVISTDS